MKVLPMEITNRCLSSDKTFRYNCDVRGALKHLEDITTTPKRNNITLSDNGGFQEKETGHEAVVSSGSPKPVQLPIRSIHIRSQTERHTHYKMMQDELSFDGLLDMEGQGTLDQSTGGFVDGLMNSEDFTLDIKWSPDTEELSSDGAPIIEPILEAAEVFDFKPEVDSWLIQDAEVTEEREENPRVDQALSINPVPMKRTRANSAANERNRERLEANKRSAQMSRDRKKAHLGELENELTHLNVEKTEITNELARLQAENDIMKKELLSLQQMISQSPLLAKSLERMQTMNINAMGRDESSQPQTTQTAVSWYTMVIMYMFSQYFQNMATAQSASSPTATSQTLPWVH
ncbi:cAMP responsive element binding protein 3 [Planoprotostelium fungivorum]|uniref:cAMP responsive element binding protein 3 n=1 Tax=Planoprotostelium fungivorum TaxID=1890364 RepID=A0A2P6NHK3_9EUKA|nr:cAMP responsive element binding protein 3 [Planoprotostelium fungivorum]